jgi:hypothetical protein
VRPFDLLTSANGQLLLLLLLVRLLCRAGRVDRQTGVEPANKTGAGAVLLLLLLLLCGWVHPLAFGLLAEAWGFRLTLFRQGSDWESLLLGGTTGAAAS